jgi:hypothetical protein
MQKLHNDPLATDIPDTQKYFTLNKQHVCVFVFFLVYLIIGISVYKDYGISWDEPTHRQIAMVTAKYVASIFMPGFENPELASLPPLAESSTRQYGVIFDLPMYVAERLLGYNGSMPEIYYMRHLCTFLLFFISVFFFFLIVRNRFQSWPLGLTACLFLILSPRIFADSFYGKDVVFLSLFIISIYFFIRYLQRKTHGNAILFALATALTVDQRITGIFIPFLAVFMTVADRIWSGKSPHPLPEKLFPLFTYLVSFLLFMIIFWPSLWSNPFASLTNAFTVMNRFPITYDVFYMGTFIESTEVPWHYIPVWIMITTPPIYILFFFLGSFLIIKEIFKNRIILYSNKNDQQDFVFLLMFATPLIAVIIFNSALYDGWRHMYFIYAPFLLIAMKGFACVLGLMKKARSGRDRRASAFIAVVVVFCLMSTSYQMFKHHPFQNVYFNILVANNAGQYFELDYWGLSFRQPLEYIIKNDKRSLIKLSANVPPPLVNNAIFLEKSDVKRLRLVNINEADYFLTNYRWHPQEYDFNNEVFTIIVDNQKIMSVFKLR